MWIQLGKSALNTPDTNPRFTVFADWFSWTARWSQRIPLWECDCALL